jgi:ABC-type transport system involved in multi-copper enzyme maturation permease subunit
MEGLREEGPSRAYYRRGRDSGSIRIRRQKPPSPTLAAILSSDYDAFRLSDISRAQVQSKRAEQRMILSLGPVMRYELITTARRRRYYFLRVIYCSFLLAQLWIFFTQWEAQHESGGSREEIQAFAEDAFIQFAGAQGIGLLLLIPALVSGIISDEYQRKTLHYLLASRLSSAEIVLGKMGARMVHVLAFIALGLPIVSLLMLYGGLNPVNIFYVYMGTATLVLFVSGFSVFISILARRPREAIMAAYGLGALWLLVPIWLKGISGYLGGTLWWVPTANDAMLMSNPIMVWSTATVKVYTWPARRMMPGRPVVPTMLPGWTTGNGFEWQFGWMAGIQAIFGLLFLVLAIAGLRPLRGSSWPGANPQTGWWVRLQARYRNFVESRSAAAITRNELLATRAIRPACGENPMLWKERYTRMGGGLKWLGSRPIALFFIVFLGCYLFDVASPVIADVVFLKWRDRDWYYMNEALRTSSFALGILAMLPITAAAATSLTSEREQDTWTSLATTLLTPREIVRAKQFGAIWSARWIGIALLAIWGTGLVLAGVHPIGLLAGGAILASSTWFVCSMGVFASSCAGNSVRALFLSFITMFVVMLASGWPVLLWSSLASYGDMRYLWSGYVPVGYVRSNLITPPFFAATVLSAIQALVAMLLSRWSIRRVESTWGDVEVGLMPFRRSKVGLVKPKSTALAEN